VRGRISKRLERVLRDPGARKTLGQVLLNEDSNREIKVNGEVYTVSKVAKISRPEIDNMKNVESVP